jgi:DNA-binding NtrC family response regulator
MNSKINLFIVDDEPEFGRMLQKVFPQDKYAVTVFSSGYQVLEAVRTTEYDVGLIDIRMPDMNGVELLKRLKEGNVMTELIVLTGRGSIPSALEATRLGCYDYLTKPARLDELEIAIQKAYEKKVLSRENRLLKEKIRFDAQYRYHELISRNPRMLQIFHLSEKVAKTSSPVLIMGESGTGKELVARAIHRSSARSGKPVIIIDCGSLSETLLENELFGHEKGAFTDAGSMKHGLFEVADGGTLFIDEIGEMKPATQVKLLRVLETHQFRRLGATQQTETDVRVIAATNRDLLQEVEKGNFRKDLYYRLNTFNITLPPLRDRREDIPLLVQHFIDTNQVTTEKKRIREEDLKTLMRYDWPGNIRELAHFIEHALIVSPNEYITPADFPVEFARHRTAVDSVALQNGLDELLAAYEKQIIREALKQARYNRREAAKILHISRSKLYRELERLSLLEGLEDPAAGRPGDGPAVRWN